VRELFDHQPVAIQPGEQIIVARDALALRRVGELEQEVRSGELALERCDGHIQGAQIARRPGRSHSQLPVRKAFTGLEGAAQNAHETVRVVEEIPERTTARRVETEGEQVLGGNIRVDGAELRVQHDDAGRQRIQQVSRIEVRDRGREGELGHHGSLLGGAHLVAFRPLVPLVSARAARHELEPRRVCATPICV